MANEVALLNLKSSVPAFAKKAELSTLAKSLAGGSGSGKRISIKGGVFRLIVDGQEVAQIEERYLDVVIVNAAPKIARTYYEGKYSEDNITAPACWSADGDRPDPTASHPQAKTCADCPQNIKGSGDNDTRACRFSQRLAVVLANDQEGDVLQLSVPAKSLFGKEEGSNMPLQAYAKWLAAQTVNPDMVVTRLKFDTKAESPKLYFKAMRWLVEDEYENAQKQGQTPDAISAITMTVAQMDHVAPVEAEAEEEEAPAPAPKAKAKTNGKAKAAKPESNDEEEPPAPAPRVKSKAQPPSEDEEDTSEPTKRTGKALKAEPAPASSKLKSLVDQWDSDD